MKRWVAKCEYDGTDFLGWQSQAGGGTIQDALEGALQGVFGKHIRIHGSGRTDTGVHAREQVFHFDVNWKHSAKDLLSAFNSKLPLSIRIYSLKKAPEDFHARYSVTGKRYVYYIKLGQISPFDVKYKWMLPYSDLDVDKMREAAKHLIGTYDFTAFSAKGYEGDSVKSLRILDIKKRGENITIATEGSGYMYKMVRSIVGTLVDVGREKICPGDVEKILSQGKRVQQVVTAPAHGLFLEKVFY